MRKKRVDTFFRQSWGERRASRLHSQERGKIVVKAVGGRIQVSCPQDEEFRQGAMALRGEWRAKSRCWSIPGATNAQRRLIATLIASIYGPQAVPQWMVARPCSQCGKEAVTMVGDLCPACEDEQRGLQRLTT